MPEQLPQFRYHPNPISSGAIETSTELCICCGRSRGFMYVARVNCEMNLTHKLCPWCIADGSASEKFNATFNDDRPLRKKGINASIIEEITKQTPGYSSWQQDDWLTHCNDGCEFHGNASSTEILEASDETKSEWQQEYNLGKSDWDLITNEYEPNGENAFYKFVCRHCQIVLVGWDCS
jgi:uncharacterized protein